MPNFFLTQVQLTRGMGNSAGSLSLHIIEDPPIHLCCNVSKNEKHSRHHVSYRLVDSW